MSAQRVTSIFPTDGAVYHFTDTAHLPWILAVGELRPGANVIGGYPAPEFVWATIDPRGSRTATAAAQRGYREGLSRLVRLTLSVDDFEPWSEVGSRYPTWTPDQVARLEEQGRRMGDDPATWWCRVQPLQLARTVAIETKAYRNPQWVTWSVRTLAVDPDNDARGVVIGNTVFYSRKITTEGGGRAYLAASQPFQN